MTGDGCCCCTYTRLIAKSAYANEVSGWLCCHTRRMYKVMGMGWCWDSDCTEKDTRRYGPRTHVNDKFCRTSKSRKALSGDGLGPLGKSYYDHYYHSKNNGEMFWCETEDK